MAGTRTFTMIKPDAVENGHIGGILNMITEAGFRIVSMKLTQLTIADAQEFYAVHNERPFFGELVEFMTRGPIVAAILEKENAVEDFRKLIGATNPADAAEGTIRKKYATSVGENAVHGSDSDENAAIEGAFHFSGREMFSELKNLYKKSTSIEVLFYFKIISLIISLLSSSFKIAIIFSLPNINSSLKTDEDRAT